MNHRNITLGDNHIPHQWEYANATARLAASGFAPADVGKLARQLDDNSLWMLTATTPTWLQVGSGAAPGGAAGGALTGTYPNPQLASTVANDHTWSGKQTFQKATVHTPVTLTDAATIAVDASLG